MAPVASSAILTALVMIACGSTSLDAAPLGSEPDAGGGGPGPVTTKGIPCDVDAVLEKNCRSCHASPPQFGAPMPLVSYDQLVGPSPSAASKRTIDLAIEKVKAESNRMPPSPNAPLGAADIAILEAWVAAGAPRSEETCRPSTVPPPNTVGCTPDLSLAPGSPWEMPSDSGDEYVCWGVDLTRPTPTHITAFAPRIDNSTIVHHIVLFESSSSYSTTPTPCNSGTSLQWRMVMGWAPGGKGLELPPEAGYPIKTSGATHYVVQMHYSNPQHLSGQKDTSGFDLCTSPPRQFEADVVAFGTQDINIPPNPPPPGFTRDCSVTVPQQLAGMHLFAAMPHMHKQGKAMTTTLTPSGGGTEVDLGTVTGWSFDTQAWLPIETVTKAGDVIRTRCTWGNDTGAPVEFGENTANEMCYSFTMYYPRVSAPVWSWAFPATASSCQ